MIPPQPQPPASSAARPRRFRPVQCIAIFLLTLIVVVGLAILIVWLVVRPRHLVYTVVSATVQNYNMTSNNHLSAAFNFSLEAYNPNSHASIYYDVVKGMLYYDDQPLAENYADPFFQPHRNVTHLDLFLPAKDTPLDSDTAKDFKVERTSGKVELVLKVVARIRFKVGIWKSRHRKLKLSCTVMVHFSSNKGIEDSYCDVDL